MAKDPVCSMQVDEKKAAATSVYKGTTYYFCGAACKVAFDNSPEKFIGKAGTHAGH
ncbi:MAG: YHS domain-containing protein [candidate division NC10 bacterium]|nr:YHS domain-containing protein [candidate division NC10 bacterium]MBI4840658.1 YHS domain-containing protein [candidate division NC10 bacterium]